MRVSRIAVLALAEGFCRLAVAGSPPPELPDIDIKNTQSNVQPATGLTLGTFKVTFETTTFANIANVSPAPLGQQGDAGGFVMWVCFTLTEERQRVWLTSSELGGQKVINGASAQVLVQGAAPTSDCPELPSQFKPVQLDSGVWLGSSIDELQRKLGPPTTGDRVAYFAHLAKDRDNDVMSTLVVRLKDQRVEMLQAGHTTTN